MKEKKKILFRIVVMICLLVGIHFISNINNVYAEELNNDAPGGNVINITMAEESDESPEEESDASPEEKKETEEEYKSPEVENFEINNAEAKEESIFSDIGDDDVKVDEEIANTNETEIKESIDSFTGLDVTDLEKSIELEENDESAQNQEEEEKNSSEKYYVTIMNGIDYSLVYDFTYFQTRYPDVREAFGDDDMATLANFVRWGMEGQRQGKEDFDEVSYRYAYADLRQAYGQDYAKYYLHYIKWGYQEGRDKTKGIEKIQKPVTVRDGVDYSLVYDYDYYSSNEDVKAAFGDDDIATLANFVRWGMEGQRQGKEDFDEISYRYAYVDLRQAYGQDYAKYYLHYIKWGYKEGRAKTKSIEKIQNPVTVKDGVDYSPVYDYEYYSSNEDVKAAFGDDDIATLANFVRWGMPSGRRGNDTFDVSFYANKYKSTLGNIYGDNMAAYTRHYVLWGYAAGLVANLEEDTKFTASAGGESVVSYANLDTSGKNIYYMFFMNDMPLENISLSASLISLRRTSAGQIIADENLITGITIDNGGEMTVTDQDRKIYYLKFMKSSLRSVSIQLEGVDLQTISAGSKDEKYEENLITFIDDDLTSMTCKEVEVKGRGDSTWQNKDKLPFQIKLSKKQSVFGMDRAKKWILLANAYDESLSRNVIAYTAAQDLGIEGSVDFEYCNLWIDGQFQGNYLICEKAEIGDGRLELENEEGALFELNNMGYSEEAYYKSTEMGYVVVKELVNDEDEAAMAEKALGNFNTKVDGLFSYLENTSEPELSGLGEYIDVESFAQYYLMADYFMCWEATDVSAFFYQDGADDVIHFGPVWDYDTSMGNMKWNLSDADRYEACNSVILSALMDTKCFREYLQEYYLNNKSVFWRTSDTNKETYQMLLSTNAAAMNFIRNPIFGQESIKTNIKKYQSSWWEAYHQLDVWLGSRINLYDPIKGCSSFMDVKRDGANLIIRAKYDQAFSLSIWLTEDEGKNIQTLTNGIRQSDGSYIFIYSLTNIREAGRITVHMNVGDENARLPEVYYYCRLKPFIYCGEDYSPVFHASYYWDHYPEIQNVYQRNDDKALFHHFVLWGMAAGWQAAEEFNISIYRENYPELEEIYGNDLRKYYRHYILWGKEGHLIAA